MSVFTKLLSIYERAGLQIRVGLNPFHWNNNRDVPFAVMFKDGRWLETGWGVSIQEIYLLETLFEEYHPQRIFIIGNAFGWSTILFALLNPSATVVALDCGIEGPYAMMGIDLTKQIVAAERLSARVVFGTSPQDVGRAVAELGGPVDFAFIDGLHTEHQQDLDYEAIRSYADPNCIYAFHDVINHRMLNGFRQLAARSPGMIARVLLRTPSGMGFLSPTGMESKVGDALRAFDEDVSRCLVLPGVVVTRAG